MPPPEAPAGARTRLGGHRVLVLAVLLALAGLVLAVVLGIGARPPGGADLAPGGTAAVAVPLPGPGGTSTFHVTARADAVTEATLVVERVAVPDAAAGAAAHLVLHDDHGRVLAQGRPAELVGARVALGRVGGPDAGPVTVVGDLTVPPESTPWPDDGVLTLHVRLAG